MNSSESFGRKMTLLSNKYTIAGELSSRYTSVVETSRHLHRAQVRCVLREDYSTTEIILHRADHHPKTKIWKKESGRIAAAIRCARAKCGIIERATPRHA